MVLSSGRAVGPVVIAAALRREACRVSGLPLGDESPTSSGSAGFRPISASAGLEVCVPGGNGHDSVPRDVLVGDDRLDAAQGVLVALLRDAERLHGPHHPLPSEIRHALQWLGQMRA
ncbi:hypothetical protein CYQ11_12090 [Streptomyces cinnamoneus]|nr:hypothetical protein CYQ11_12090 [Streptomyces cinnamoneus]